MAVINVPWIEFPTGKYEQLDNGTRGIVFRLSNQYVGKILYGSEDEGKYWMKKGDEAFKELGYEEEICKILYDANIGNVPRPIGIEELKIFNGTYPTFIMEYIKDIPRGDEIGDSSNQFIAKALVRDTVYRAADVDVFPSGMVDGKETCDYLNPKNYFYDESNERVRLIDFGRWVTGDTVVSPYA